MYRPIETLTTENMIRPYKHSAYKKISKIGKNVLNNPGDSIRDKNRLFCLSRDQYPDLIEDLYITGSHAILEDELSDKERQNIIEQFGRVFVTEDKYRLMACVDERAKPWTKEGCFVIYHLALDDANERRNFGIYANGLLVETTSLLTF